MADTRLYDTGTRPRIYINWETFEDWGIPSNWKWPFAHAVMNAYTRWMQVAGVDMRFQFWNFTSKTSADDGELLIKMNERHGSSTRVASTFGRYGKLEIVFHRKRGSDLTPYTFTPYNAEAGELDMQAILMHELGHAFGLDHSSSGQNTMFGGYGYIRGRFGPFAADVEDLRSIYPNFTENRLRQQRSRDGGESWSPQSHNIDDINHPSARTTLHPGAVAVPESGQYLVGWSAPSRAPTWLRGDGAHFPTRRWLIYGGERSVHGPAYASSHDGTLLWAWVDDANDGTLKLARSRNRGYDWHLARTPANARTHGTPALCWTEVGGRGTWILVWADFNRSKREETGLIMTSTSTDDGSTWSEAKPISTFYHALSGVAAAADGANHIAIAFAWAPYRDHGNRMNRIRTFDAYVQGNDVRRARTGYLSDTTRIQPALAYDSTRDRFIMAWRGQNVNTTIQTLSKSPGESTWQDRVHLVHAKSHVAPALAHSTDFEETVLWYAHEEEST